MAKVAVLNCRQLVTMAGPPGPRTGAAMGSVDVIIDGGMLIENGRIASVGRSADIKDGLTSDFDVLDAMGQVCLPGFVDAHTHPVFAGNRANEFAMRASGATYQEIAANGGGILSTVRKTREASLNDLVDLGVERADSFLAHGTTTIEAKSGYGLSLHEEVRLLQAIATVALQSPLRIEPTLLAAHAFPLEFREDREAYVNQIVRDLPEMANTKLAKWCDIFVEAGYFEPSHARRIMAIAKEMGLGIRMHVDQLRDGGGAALAAELGAKTADHLEHMPASAFQILNDAGVMPVLLPASVFCLGLDRYPDARGMIDAGLPVVLATDFNPGSSPTLSMPFVMSLAITKMRLSPEEALTAATTNAAQSLDLGNRIGSLEPGKQADFSIWPIDDWREIAYWVASLRPSQVFVGGKRAN